MFSVTRASILHKVGLEFGLEQTCNLMVEPSVEPNLGLDFMCGRVFVIQIQYVAALLLVIGEKHDLSFVAVPTTVYDSNGPLDWLRHLH